MKKQTMITFRASVYTITTLTRLMNERNVDRTSIIKLALYLLDTYMQRPRIQRMNMLDIVRSIEKHSHISFSDYSLGYSLKPSHLEREKRVTS